MQIQLVRKNDHVHFEATNTESNTVQIDGAASIGGEGNGMRPMELLLTSVAACASFDVVTILRKQRQDLQDIRIEAEGERASEGDAKPFRAVRLHFRLWGTLDEKKVARAIELAVTKYCSVAESLHPDIQISHRFTLEAKA